MVRAGGLEAPIKARVLVRVAETQGRRLRPSSSPSRRGSSRLMSSAVRGQHPTHGAPFKWVLPLNRAAQSDARAIALLCTSRAARAAGCGL